MYFHGHKLSRHAPMTVEQRNVAAKEEIIKMSNKSCKENKKRF